MLAIDLTDKIAVVTGSTQGLGLGITRMLAKAGCHVAGCGLDAPDSKQAKSFLETVRKERRSVYYEQVDLKKQDRIPQFITNAKEQLGSIDILISNAGKNMFSAPEESTLGFWEEDNHLNLRSHWLLSKACYEDLKTNNGFILLMTSNHAYGTLLNCFPYNVSKAGIVGMVKALAIFDPQTGNQMTKWNSQNGECLQSIAVPAQVTSCCFGGPELDRLFITTARIGRSTT